MRYIMALLLSLALAVPAFAGFEGPNASTGGFAGPGPQTITKAAQVQNALDDTTCTLEGNILERLSKNKYVFQDDSGKITVEIGQRIFGSNRVTPETRVRYKDLVRPAHFLQVQLLSGQNRLSLRIYLVL